MTKQPNKNNMPKTAAKKSARRSIDWEAIEKQYRLGQKSMRTIADEFGVNVSNISRRAKKQGWVQDKSDEVRERTKATLIAQQERNTPSREDIDAAVRTNVEVIRGHQKRIKSQTSIIEILESQLRDVANNREAIEDLIVDETKKEDGKPNLKRRNAMMKAVSLPMHAGVARDLSMALKNLIPLERQAFNIDDKSPNSDDDIGEIKVTFVSPDDRK